MIPRDTLVVVLIVVIVIVIIVIIIIAVVVVVVIPGGFDGFLCIAIAPVVMMKSIA